MPRMFAAPLQDQPLRPAAPRWIAPRSGRGLILPLDPAPFATLPESLLLGATRLARKHEFHITLLNGEHWKTAVAAVGIAQVRALFEQVDWQMHADGRFWLVSRQPGATACTIIAMLHAPGAQRFRSELAQAGAPLPPPIPHVTLYQAGAPGGIGIAGPEQWQQRACGELAIDWDRQTALPRAER